MTNTTIIIVNAILGFAVVYGLVSLLAFGIHSDRPAARQASYRRLPQRASDRIAA